jgi:putative membrane protein
MKQQDKLPVALLVGVLALLVWSGLRPHDYPTWALEVFPAVFGLVALGVTYRRFPLTPLCYWLIAVHLVLLIVGGHYTYAEVPIGNWAKETFDLSRNHYDRVGHFLQGFVPAIIAREVLIRNHVLARRGWLSFIVVSICTAISGVYELVEWAVAEVDQGGSAAFLGTQGDIWDTQKDIALCLIGATIAVLTLTRWHDRQIARLTASKGSPAA